VISYIDIAPQIFFTVAKLLLLTTQWCEWTTEQTRRHASAWRHRWPALLTILNKILFISTKWPY